MEIKEDDAGSPADGGPSVLIMGGTGFIARHMIAYLLDQNLAGSIVAADKNIPDMAYMTSELRERYRDPRVTFLHSDLSKDDHLTRKIFPDGKTYDIIINLCGETRFGQTDVDYEKKCLTVVQKVADMVLKVGGLKRWVEISTGQVYESSKEPVKEDAPIKPWTRLAHNRYMAELTLHKKRIPTTILRPAIVYGPGDRTGLTPRLVCAAGYKDSGEKMEFLWSKGVRINTVHVRDVVRAIWLAATDIRPGQTFNLADPSDFTQLDMNKIISSLFGIKVGFKGAITNKAAKNFMDQVAKTVNQKHLPEWQKLLTAHDITTTPLSPYLDKEILLKNHFGVDGSAITRLHKFKYQYPGPTVELMREVVMEYIKQGYYPPLL